MTWQLVNFALVQLERFLILKTLNDLVLFLFFAVFMAHDSLDLFQIDDLRRWLVGLGCGRCDTRCRCGLLLIGITFGLRRALFVLVRYSHVFSQAVLVFKGFLTVLTLPGRLRRMLGAYMSPKIHRRDDELAILTLSPLAVRLLARFLFRL